MLVGTFIDETAWARKNNNVKEAEEKEGKGNETINNEAWNEESSEVDKPKNHVGSL